MLLVVLNLVQERVIPSVVPIQVQDAVLLLVAQKHPQTITPIHRVIIPIRRVIIPLLKDVKYATTQGKQLILLLAIKVMAFQKDGGL